MANSDLAHADVGWLLEQAQVNHVLIKGPATRSLIGWNDRPAGDVDVFVRQTLSSVWDSNSESARTTRGFRN